MTLVFSLNQWKSVIKRDKAYDGVFFYAVRSTGIYCRPSCPSRRPKEDQVSFFDSAEAAVENGYRACLRCQPDRLEGASEKIDLVQGICRFIEQCSEPPSLDELAANFNLSPSYLQRTFKKVLGISPHQYADEQRVQRFKRELRHGTSVTGALYKSGYNSSSSVYQEASERLGMTPVHYRSGAAQIAISFTIARCPLGRLLVARTDKGICALSLGDAQEELLAWLKEEFPQAIIGQDDRQSAEYVASILQYLEGKQPHCDLPLDLRASAFQRRVWEELRRIPYGSTRSYSEVAQAIGQPSASRAVARACATNLVSLVVPCHRVVRQGGNLGGYRWGIERKKALLELENRQKSSLKANTNPESHDSDL